MHTTWESVLGQGWQVPLISVVLLVAACIDGWKLKVPNWLTFPFVLTGWIHGFAVAGWTGLGESLLGTAVGLALLLPAYAIGGMGAGDVKLLAGVGAWVGAVITFYAFCVSAVVGGILAVAMIAYRRSWYQHYANLLVMFHEFTTVRQPTKLAALAAERKPTMVLLPYGIPLAIGSIGYFFWAGLL